MNAPEEGVEDYERAVSEVSTRYRELPADQVPAALDAAILAQAREEIQKTKRSQRWRRWSASFALAASSVLAISILFRSGSEPETLITREAPQSVSAPPALAVQVPSPSEAAQDESSAEQKPSAEPLRDQVPVAKMAAQPARAPSVAASRAAEPPLEKRIREKLDAAPAPVSAPSTQQFALIHEERVAVPRSSQLANHSGRAADAIEQSPAPSAPAAAAEFKKTAAKFDAAEAAERWLADIRKLRADGHVDDADKQWREFRKAFPDYTVSDDDAARPAP